MRKKVKLKIFSRQYDLAGEMLFDMISEQVEGMSGGKLPADFDENTLVQNASETFELMTEATYEKEGSRISISYAESELTGMDGATTTISYDEKNPTVLSMMRGGSYYTVLVFEEGRRHICAYNTGIMPFELCVQTFKVRNELNAEGYGHLILDYLVEIKGAKAQRTKFRINVSPLK